MPLPPPPSAPPLFNWAMGGVGEREKFMCGPSKSVCLSGGQSGRESVRKGERQTSSLSRKRIGCRQIIVGE